MLLLNRAQNVDVNGYFIASWACLWHHQTEGGGDVIQDIALVAIAIVKLITGSYNLLGLCWNDIWGRKEAIVAR